MSASSDDHLDHPDTARLLDDLPVPLMVYRRDGLLCAMNRRAEQFWQTDRAAIVGRFNLMEDPQSVEQGSAALFARALAGERITTDPAPYDTRQVDPQIARHADQRLWISATIFPLHDAAGAPSHVVLMHADVTGQIEQRSEIESALGEISRQRAEIENLSSPIIRVWDGILTVPLVGLIDGRRAMGVTERLLEAIVEHQADIVILDITGVPVVDTGVAAALMQAARAVRLLGSQAVLVGLSAEVAQTLVQLGADLADVVTLANLQAGIAWAFGRLGLAVRPA